jgi:hypothetical protein
MIKHVVAALDQDLLQETTIVRRLRNASWQAGFRAGEDTEQRTGLITGILRWLTSPRTVRGRRRNLRVLIGILDRKPFCGGCGQQIIVSRHER